MDLIKSILTLTCPRCRIGKLFAQPFNFTNALKMPYHCPHCDQRFYPEPGFYYGALFMSYILSVWPFFFLGLFFTMVLGWGFNATIGMILLTAALTYVYFYRLARSIWLHFFVKFDPEYQMQKARVYCDSGKKNGKQT